MFQRQRGTGSALVGEQRPHMLLWHDQKHAHGQYRGMLLILTGKTRFSLKLLMRTIAEGILIRSLMAVQSLVHSGVSHSFSFCYKKNAVPLTVFLSIC